MDVCSSKVDVNPELTTSYQKLKEQFPKCTLQWKYLKSSCSPRNTKKYIYFSLKAWYINPTGTSWHYLVDPGGIPWPHPQRLQAKPLPPLPICQWDSGGHAQPARFQEQLQLKSWNMLKHVETMTSSLATEIWIMILYEILRKSESRGASRWTSGVSQHWKPWRPQWCGARSRWDSQSC
jgi:hypothetical protein